MSEQEQSLPKLARVRTPELHEGGPRLVLVGPMGSGKTTVGTRVANRLGLAFVDSDREIEREAARSIPEIFASEGEQYFRELEERVIARLLAEHEGILSLGGGAVTSPATRERLRNRLVVRLLLDADHARERIGSGMGRPVLAGDDPHARWIRVNREREPLFAEVAVWALDTCEASPDELAATLARELTSPQPTTTLD